MRRQVEARSKWAKASDAYGSNVFGFVIQSFVHELAVAAHRDHLAFLLELVGEPKWFKQGDLWSLNTRRAAKVIKLAAERAGWGRAMPEGRALGLGFYFSHAGHVAEIADVSVDASKKLKVNNVTVAAPALSRRYVFSSTCPTSTDSSFKYSSVRQEQRFPGTTGPLRVVVLLVREVRTRQSLCRLGSS
jgi:hypothetical protein